MNCKEEGPFHWACPNGHICRLCNLEGHIAMDCPTAKTFGKKGHPVRRCFNKPEAIINNTEARIAKDKGTEYEAQEDPSQDKIGDWHQWVSQNALREAMAKKIKRIVVKVTTECKGEKRKPRTKKSCKTGPVKIVFNYSVVNLKEKLKKKSYKIL